MPPLIHQFSAWLKPTESLPCINYGKGSDASWFFVHCDRVEFAALTPSFQDQPQIQYTLAILMIPTEALSAAFPVCEHATDSSCIESSCSKRRMSQLTCAVTALFTLQPLGMIRCGQNNMQNIQNTVDIMIFNIDPIENHSTILKDMFGHVVRWPSSASLQHNITLVPMIVHQIAFQTISPYEGERLHHAIYNKDRFPLPSCPVCLYRVEPRYYYHFSTADVFSVPTQVKCSHICMSTDIATERPWMRHPMCSNLLFLLSPHTYPFCRACPLIHERILGAYNKNFVSDLTATTITQRTCHSCNMTETLWVCLTCGTVGCGRYSSGHAQQHYNETNHPWALELATQRIWDYSSGSFAQRNDLLMCPLMRRCIIHTPSGYPDIHPSWTNLTSTGDNKDENFLYKSSSIGEEYEALLQSALDDQAQHYEEEIAKVRCLLESSHLHPTSDCDRNATSDPVWELRETIEQLRKDIKSMNQKILDAQEQQAQYQAKSDILMRQQALTKNILAQLHEQVKTERNNAKAQIDEWEQQIEDLMNNIRMRHQIAHHEELADSQIIGCSFDETTKKGRRKGTIARRSKDGR